MIPDLFFYLALSFLLVHEMDAIRCKEWRIFPLTYFLNDKIGYLVFMTLHIPLFYMLFWGLKSDAYRNDLITGLDYFSLIHFVLHIIFLKHKKNEFKDALSWTIITGAALFGLLDLISKR